MLLYVDKHIDSCSYMCILPKTNLPKRLFKKIAKIELLEYLTAQFFLNSNIALSL